MGLSGSLQWKLHFSSNKIMILWYAWFPAFPATILKLVFNILFFRKCSYLLFIHNCIFFMMNWNIETQFLFCFYNFCIFCCLSHGMEMKNITKLSNLPNKKIIKRTILFIFPQTCKLHSQDFGAKPCKILQLLMYMYFLSLCFRVAGHQLLIPLETWSRRHKFFRCSQRGPWWNAAFSN